QPPHDPAGGFHLTHRKHAVRQVHAQGYSVHGDFLFVVTVVSQHHHGPRGRKRRKSLFTRSSRIRFVTAKAWRKSLPRFRFHYASRLNSGVRIIGRVRNDWSFRVRSHVSHATAGFYPEQAAPPPSNISSSG